MLKFSVMTKCPLFLFALFFVFINFTTVSAEETTFLSLSSEPLIRIGLATNARSVSITTSDSSLVAMSPGEPNKLLATNKIYVTPRAYRPPEIEIYTFRDSEYRTAEEADNLAKDIREATGEKTVVDLDSATNTWRVRIGDTKETIEEANQYKADLADKGFEEVVDRHGKENCSLPKTRLRFPSN